MLKKIILLLALSCLTISGGSTEGDSLGINNWVLRDLFDYISL